ncbi:DEAD/DEAH box helicase [Oscillibacter sp.]|uniref:SUV3 family DEAD/DEAH box RNA helicase n=1 Tax=Oscillibacter sp. TaxID=1945593 RepID=UPI0028AB614B|nr:DEAD/DEAH box helicase [Oscillibacter sp.]
MKKERKQRLAFERVKHNFSQIQRQSFSSRARSLWHNESSIRSQLRQLGNLTLTDFPDGQEVYAQYTALLDNVSRRVLEQYNRKTGTNYSFDAVVAENRAEYLRSGILSVLLSSHIPGMVRGEFHRLLPRFPQDEYPEARREKRMFYLHLGDTNTGKTYQAMLRLRQSPSGIYLAPLRILALENYERLNAEGLPCSLLTGEEEVLTPGAKHLCCTVEKANLSGKYDVAAIDEAQLLADSQRGDAWTRAILGLSCPEIHLCGAMLAKEQLTAMIRDCGDDYEFKSYTRLVPLQPEYAPVKLKSVGKGDALVAFSKAAVLSLSRYLGQMGIRSSVIYGDLPPEVRKGQYDAFIRGENPVLVATDAIGMGVNLPIRRLIFTELEKFDGESRRPLTSQEIKQIAGRAGRIGIYDVGYVACLDERIPVVEEKLAAEDEPIEQAVVGPSESILQIGLLPLREKLALWSTETETLPYYRKKDVNTELFLLDILEPYHLPEQMQWRLMRVPFSLGNSALLAQFSGYAHACFIANAQHLEKPVPEGPSCEQLESYYQQINLYYSFSKAMNLPLDEQWVLDTRNRVSDRIRSALEALRWVRPEKTFRGRER